MRHPCREIRRQAAGSQSTHGAGEQLKSREIHKRLSYSLVAGLLCAVYITMAFPSISLGLENAMARESLGKISL